MQAPAPVAQHKNLQDKNKTCTHAPPTPVAQHEGHTRALLILKFPSFLLNRDDNSTPSFLSSLKVLLRHRKYILSQSAIADTTKSELPLLSFTKYRNFNRFPFQFDEGFTKQVLLIPLTFYRI